MYLTKGSYILSRSMKADILESKKDLYLVQKYGGRYFAKVEKDLYLVQKYGGRYFGK